MTLLLSSYPLKRPQLVAELMICCRPQSQLLFGLDCLSNDGRAPDEEGNLVLWNILLCSYGLVMYLLALGLAFTSGSFDRRQPQRST